MQARSLEYVRAACAGELRAGSSRLRVSRVCTDSRRVQKGDLFFAIKGDKFDGHDFLPEVAAKGAAAIVAEAPKLPAANLNCAVITVDNTRQALGRLAARYRADFELPVIAVGGSNGKTSTKELLASVLRQQFNTLSSEASFNNDIGVPLTLLNLESNHRVAVLEAGTNHPGELAPLIKMIQPRFGVITSIGREHLEFFGDLAGVAREEGWLAELLPASGKLFLHGDNPWTPELEKRARAKAVRVGTGPQNAWRLGKTQTGAKGVSFQVIAPRPEYEDGYRIQLLGQHQALNALFAIAVGAELGLEPGQIQRGLQACQPAKMRMQVFAVRDVTILDDAYNANADSVRAALQTLHDFPSGGRRVAVLGTMAELGSHSAGAHAEAGRCAAQLGVAHLLAVGPWARAMAQAAREQGLASVACVPDVPEAIRALKKDLQAGDVVLLKASRNESFERISDALKTR